MSLVPFFVVEGIVDDESRVKKDVAASIIAQMLGSSAMRGLRLEALSLVRSVSIFLCLAISIF